MAELATGGAGGGTAAPVASTGSAPASSGLSGTLGAAPSPTSASDLSNQSMESAVDALLSGSDAAAAPAPATEPTTGAEGAGANAPPEADGASAQVAPPVDAASDAADDPDAPDDDLEAAQADEGKPQNLLDLKRPRGQRIYGAYKQFKALTDALGHEPTVEEVQEHLAAYSDRLAMEDEFASGDPSAHVNFLNYWHGTNPQAFTQLAQQMPDYLAQTNQQAYVQLAMPVINRFLNQLYQNAQTEQNGDLKKALLYAARMNDWYLNGTYRDDANLPVVPDNLTQREAQIQAGLAQINQFQQSQAASAASQWSQALDNAHTSTVSNEVQKALEPLKSALPQRLYKAAERDFAEAIRDHIAKDVEGERIYNIQRNQAQRRMSREDLASLQSAYSQRVSRAVRALAPGFLKEAGIAAKTASTQRNAALQAAVTAGTAPSSAGAPVPQSILPTPKQYASRTEQMEASIDALLGLKR
jgi:hypothetical protein